MRGFWNDTYTTTSLKAVTKQLLGKEKRELHSYLSNFNLMCSHFNHINELLQSPSVQNRLWQIQRQWHFFLFSCSKDLQQNPLCGFLFIWKIEITHLKMGNKTPAWTSCFRELLHPCPAYKQEWNQHTWNPQRVSPGRVMVNYNTNFSSFKFHTK